MCGKQASILSFIKCILIKYIGVFCVKFSWMWKLCSNWQGAFEDRQKEQPSTYKQTLQAKTKKPDWTSEKEWSLATHNILWLKVRSNCKIIRSSFKSQKLFADTHSGSPKDLLLISFFLFISYHSSTVVKQSPSHKIL